MKLAEALTHRADCQRKLAQLKDRMVRNAKVQEGEQPAEDPFELLRSYQGKVEEFEQLVMRINRTNSATAFSEQLSLADALTRRDALALQRDVLFELAKAATVTQDRHRASEIVFRGAVSVRETQQQADQLAKAYRELDLEIQQLNWTTELLD